MSNPRLVPKDSKYFKELLTRQFLKTCTLLLLLAYFFAIVGVYYYSKSNARLQINCVLWFQGILIKFSQQQS